MFTDTLMAATQHYGWGGGPGPWFLLFPLFWIAVFVTLGLVFGRRRRAMWRNGRYGQCGPNGSHGAEHTLRERYARGEIDAEEYQTRLATLREE